MDNRTLENLIINRSKEIIENCNQLFPNSQIEFKDFTFNFKLKGCVAGQAWYTKKMLKFNLILASENLTDFFNDTIPHEIAHIYTDKIFPRSTPHGQQWKYIMSTMGFKPVRCHNYDTQTVKKLHNKMLYIYSCPCGNIFKLSKLIHGKIVNGQKRSCNICKGQIYFTKTIK